MIDLEVEYGVCGFYKIDVVDSRGDIKKTSGWFKNLITNAGMDRRASSVNYLEYCHVGTGSSTPAYSDTILGNKIATTTSLYSRSSGVASASPYYAYITKTFSFAAGVVVGNISEVGVGWDATGNLFSRALIVDGTGNPTSLTILSGEELRITYQFRLYIPETDVTGSVMLGGVSYAYTCRAASANQAYTGTWVAYENEGANYTGTQYVFVYTGGIGAITGQPSGTQVAGATTQTTDAYVAGSNSISHNTTWGTDSGNAVGGIASIKLRLGSGCYQFGFTPVIPKDSTKILTLKITHTWSRA